MHSHIAYSGAAADVEFAICLNQSRPGLEFYNGLSPRDQAKVLKLFQWLGEHGWIKNNEKWKPIAETEFFEFKSFQVRLPCFRSGSRRFVITHGFIKKQDAIAPSEIERAQRIKSEHERISKAAGFHR
mgnify:CR=1 FL=1